MKDQVSSPVTFELRPGGFLFHRLDDGRVMIVVSTVMESWAAHRMGRDLQVKSRVVCKSERKLLDASVRLPWRPPSVREA